MVHYLGIHEIIKCNTKYKATCTLPKKNLFKILTQHSIIQVTNLGSGIILILMNNVFDQNFTVIQI